MDIIMFLVPIALMLGLLALGAFFWAMKNGQFEDLDGAACRMLFGQEEDGTKPTQSVAEPEAHTPSETRKPDGA